MSQELPLFADDPCAGRHRASATSIDAHHKITTAVKRKAHLAILDLAEACGDYGVTVHEVADHLRTTPNGVSGRLTELKAAGRLVPKLDGQGILVRRRGAAVLVIAQ